RAGAQRGELLRRIAGRVVQEDLARADGRGGEEHAVAGGLARRRSRHRGAGSRRSCGHIGTGGTGGDRRHKADSGDANTVQRHGSQQTWAIVARFSLANDIFAGSLTTWNNLASLSIIRWCEG